MPFLLDALRALGVSGNLFIAGALGLAAFYLVRGKRYAGAAAAAAGSAVVYGVVVLAALALAIGLGWLNPRIDLIRAGIDTALGPLKAFVDGAGDLVSDVLVEALE